MIFGSRQLSGVVSFGTLLYCVVYFVLRIVIIYILLFYEVFVTIILSAVRRHLLGG